MPSRKVWKAKMNMRRSAADDTSRGTSAEVSSTLCTRVASGGDGASAATAAASPLAGWWAWTR